jgi:hypothetical protein
MQFAVYSVGVGPRESAVLRESQFPVLACVVRVVAVLPSFWQVESPCRRALNPAVSSPRRRSAVVVRGRCLGLVDARPSLPFSLAFPNRKHSKVALHNQSKLKLGAYILFGPWENFFLTYCKQCGSLPSVAPRV